VAVCLTKAIFITPIGLWIMRKESKTCF
jgi:hypothetical protein